MMKRLSTLILISILILGFQRSFSQTLILGPDTLCAGNALQLNTNVTGASSYYWGFCSAYLNNIPTGSSIAAGTGLDAPSSITMGKDGNNYFIFVINTNLPRNVIRYEFGTNLASAPLATNLGDFGGSIPLNCKGFELVNENGKWYGFAVGGTTAVNSDMIRFDFGSSLANTPTLATIGNLGGLLLNPQDLYFFNEAGKWHAFTNNGFSGNLIRLDFDTSISTMPTLVDLGNPGSLAFPTGFWPVFDGTNWHLFVVNRQTQTLSRLDFGNSLLNGIVDNNLGNFGGIFSGPRDISIIRDCGNYYGYVTNETGDGLTLLTFTNNITSLPTATALGNFAGFDGPRFLTRYLRDRDNVFSFTANNVDNSLSRLEYNSCTASSVPFSTLQTPPPVYYSGPGVYNVFFASDEGLPTMQVDCKLITVLPKPLIQLNNDTLICQGDTIQLIANGPGLISNLWNPIYNGIAPYDSTVLRVYPHEDYRYYVHLEYTAGGGCAYDTSVLVKVSRVVADAGLDRFVVDGGYTVLGGPHLSTGQEYSYLWTPTLYLNDTSIAYPTCTPKDVQPYYLTVTNDTTGCVSKDSVWVRTECTDIHLPNAFNPVSDIPENRNFGLLNFNVVKLEYFKIFNRWGQLVFSTTIPTKKWDGTQNNIDLPPDNYVWMIDGYCNNGKRIKKQGTVLLTR